MEYNYNSNDYPPNVTPISDMNDLPNLEKFIRTPHRGSYNQQEGFHNVDEMQNPQMIQNFQSPPQQQLQQLDDPSMVMSNDHPNPNTSSCVEFYEHVKSCPICSKFYNNDNSVYIIIIVLMIIVIIILLKKILKV